MPHEQVDGRQIYYELHPCRGAATSPPLVLITGLGASCRGWLPLQVPEFSRGRDVLVFDHRGAGQSEGSDAAFTTADLARDTAGLLRALSIDRADALGAFMGGMVAQQLALDLPEGVRRLVLVGTYAAPDPKRRILLEYWAQLARSGMPLAAMTRERLVWTLQDETFEQTDLIDAMIEFFEKEETPATPDLFARQCDACIEHDTRKHLGELRQPTLVVCGRQDQLTPPRLHRQLADAIPNAHLVTLTYGGHLVMAESAERFNQVVVQFLDD